MTETGMREERQKYRKKENTNIVTYGKMFMGRE
jgi:hypothetical protein